jgi:TonB-dependent starch-binding outer membrane protein SusC
MLCNGFDKACFLRKAIILLLLLPVWSYGQEISLDLKNATVEEVFSSIQKQSDFRFVYAREETAGLPSISLSIKQKPLKEVLDQLFLNLPLDYAIEERFIIIRKKEKPIPALLTVSGRVSDEEGKSIAGATVAVKGSKKAAATNEAGLFELTEVDEKGVLQISSIGYASREVAVEGRSFLEIRLGVVVSPLDETVVVAYGTTTQRLNTGSVGRITAEDIEKQPVMNPLAALEGRIPGVLITQSSGVPGSSFKIEIRGQTALDLNLSRNDPLFIIDGVPFAPGNAILSQLTSAANYNDPFKGLQGGLSPLNNINAADIESIEVLKDADATAIYGSRGANGVVLITTKKGKGGDTRVNVNIYSGVSRVNRTMDMLNTRQYVAMRKEAFANDNISATTINAPDLLLWDTTRYTDLKKLLIGSNACTNDVQASVSGGSNLTRFLIGGGYHKETTVYPGDLGDSRASAHVNLKHGNANEKFSVHFSGYYSIDNNKLPTADLTNFINLPPHIKLYDSAGGINWKEGGVAFSSVNSFSNPLAEVLKKYTVRTENLLSHFQITYRLFKGFHVKASVGYNTVITDEESNRPKTANDPQLNLSGASNFAFSHTQSWITEPQAEYNSTIGGGKLVVLAGATAQEIINKGQTISASNYTNDLLLGSVAGAGSINASNSFDKYRYQAFFGRISYNWRERYLINLSGRRDGSSRFGPGKRFANFGAVGAGWIFSNEPKITKDLSFLSYGKIRVSYGTSGNDQIGNYQFFDRWTNTSNGYQGSPGLQAVSLYNPDYNWEETRKLEAALETGFFKDRILITIAGYRHRTSNQLVGYVLPIQAGFSSINKNLPALVENKGLEFSVATKNISSINVLWRSQIVLTIPKNTLLSFPGLSGTSYASMYKEGASLSAIRGYRYIGIDPATGLYTFDDVNRDGKTSIPEDYMIYDKSTDPEFYGGIGNLFHYKEFEVYFFFDFRKQRGLNYLSNLGARIPGMIYNQPTIVLQRWQPGSTDAAVTKYTTSFATPVYSATIPFRNSDAIFGDASFIRLRTVSFSYRFSKKLLEKVRIENSRIYVQAQNLLTITNYKGADPENQNLYALPSLSIITAGLEINF